MLLILLTEKRSVLLQLNEFPNFFDDTDNIGMALINVGNIAVFYLRRMSKSNQNQITSCWHFLHLKGIESIIILQLTCCPHLQDVPHVYWRSPKTHMINHLKNIYKTISIHSSTTYFLANFMLLTELRS